MPVRQPDKQAEGEPGMTSSIDSSRREALRAVLLQRQEALLAAQALRNQGATRVQHAREVLLQDGDDAPARAADREVDLALTDHERQELAEIGQALQRLDTDDYGLCGDCGADIAFERLQVQPQALRCIGCEQAREVRAHSAIRHATI
jgi:DnaK suppressor protein